MTNPTPEQRLAFAHGIALLLLKHVKMTDEDKAYVESIRDAQTPEQMLECWRNALASAAAYASTSAYALTSACEWAVKAGVPEVEVKALRALTLGIQE